MLLSACLRYLRPAMKASRLRASLARARGGNVAVVVGLSTPAIATLVFGAVDVASVINDRGRMQSIADAAALAGARNLSVAMRDSSAEGFAQAMATSMIGEWQNAPALTVSVETTSLDEGGKAIKVVLDARRGSLFGDLLPPGGWQYAVESVATSVASTPLCILTTNEQLTDSFLVGGSSQIRAPECLLHSNNNVKVNGLVDARQTQAVRSATGNITPDPITDVPAIPDPFADRTSPAMLPCLGKLKNAVFHVTKGTHTLPAGKHCGLVEIAGTANVVLAPGEHYFQIGAVVVRDSARLTGSDVVMIFDTTSFMNLLHDSVVNISGRESGPYTGFAVMTARGNVRTFTIDSTHVERLDGVIYVPDATLRILGRSDVARQSDWTVIVAKSLRLSGSPRLYLNADYAASDIDVPTGVGPRDGGARLID